MKLARRLEDFEAYLGTAMNVILTKMKEEGKDVINLGLGDPDVVPPQHMRKTLADDYSNASCTSRITGISCMNMYLKGFLLSR